MQFVPRGLIQLVMHFPQSLIRKYKRGIHMTTRFKSECDFVVTTHTLVHSILFLEVLLVIFEPRLQWFWLFIFEPRFDRRLREKSWSQRNRTKDIPMRFVRFGSQHSRNKILFSAEKGVCRIERHGNVRSSRCRCSARRRRGNRRCRREPIQHFGWFLVRKKRTEIPWVDQGTFLLHMHVQHDE